MRFRQKLADLKSKYDKEAQRSEEEFQRKFAEFLQGQKEFPENILLKRQHELQDLLTKSIRFKEESQKLLVQAEKDLQADMLYLLNEAIRAVGRKRVCLYYQYGRQYLSFYQSCGGRRCDELCERKASVAH